MYQDVGGRSVGDGLHDGEAAVLGRPEAEVVAAGRKAADLKDSCRLKIPRPREGGNSIGGTYQKP